MPHTDKENYKTNSSTLTLAIDYLKAAQSLLRTELKAVWQEANRTDALRLDARTMSLVEGINDLSKVITELESDRDEYIVTQLDQHGLVIQERPARDLGQALRWTEEMQEEMKGFPGLATFECSIDER